MITKEKILKLFETSRDVYFSGEDIAPKLCCKTNCQNCYNGCRCNVRVNRSRI